MRFILLGAPGAGKGTQAEKIAARFNIPKLSTGDILRAEVSSGTELGNKIEAIMNSGAFVSDDIMISLINKRLREKDCAKGFILDGFPRTIPQAEELDKIFDALPQTTGKTYIILLEVDEDDLIKRLSGRYSCKICGTGYHNKYKNTKVKGICDKCGSEEFVYREDDKEEAVKTRLLVYREKVIPLIEYYKKKGVLHKVNGMQKIDDISRNIFEVVKVENNQDFDEYKDQKEKAYV